MRMGIRLMQLGSPNLGSRIRLTATYPIAGFGRASAFNYSARFSAQFAVARGAKIGSVLEPTIIRAVTQSN
jgi:hypothetical protein